MKTEDITLNIAVNLGRLARFASEGREARVTQFINDTDQYLIELERAPKSPQFNRTYKSFVKEYGILKKNRQMNDEWAEKALTWSNILSHRAKLA